MQMKKVNFGSTGKQVPAIVMGCMRMKELTVKEAAKLVDAAMAEGVDFFDHADIYGGGVCLEAPSASYSDSIRRNISLSPTYAAPQKPPLPLLVP